MPRRCTQREVIEALRRRTETGNRTSDDILLRNRGLIRSCLSGSSAVHELTRGELTVLKSTW